VRLSFFFFNENINIAVDVDLPEGHSRCHM
jgi:hypothetical protein